MTNEERLRAFALDILEDWPDGCGIDGFDLQDLAVKHGLLEPVDAAEPCDPEHCWCAEYHGSDGFPVVCYRKTPLLTALTGSAVEPGASDAPR